MAFDFLFEAPEDNPTPELAAETAAVSLQQLDGFRRGQSDADPRIAELDEFFRQSVEQHGAAFLTSLADRPRVDTRVLGLHDAVRPEGRLWDLRDVFVQATPRDLEILGVDNTLVYWHTSPNSLNPDTTRSMTALFGIPEWAIAGKGTDDQRGRLLATLRVDTRYLDHRRMEQLDTIYGVAPFLAAEGQRLVDIMVNGGVYEELVKDWTTVATALGRDLGNRHNIENETAKAWIDIVLADQILNSDAKLTVFCTASPSDAEVKLWNALDYAVTHGRTRPFGPEMYQLVEVVDQWAERFVEMRSRTGELQISPLDMRLLGLPRAAEIIVADRDLEEPYKVSRSEFNRMCVLVSRFTKVLPTNRSKMTKDDYLAASDVLSMLSCAQPPLYATASRRQGSHLRGRLRAAIGAR